MMRVTCIALAAGVLSACATAPAPPSAADALNAYNRGKAAFAVADFHTAYNAFSIAASVDHADSACFISDMHLRMDDFRTTDADLKRWMLRCAETGKPRAYQELGYVHDTQADVPDVERAWQWYLVARCVGERGVDQRFETLRERTSREERVKARAAATDYLRKRGRDTECLVAAE